MSLEVDSVFKCMIAESWPGSFLFGLTFLLAPAVRGGELTFPTLPVGSHTYSNVIVTSKAQGYVIISHAQGMASIKLKDLSPDILTALGYEVAPVKPKGSGSL